MFVIRSLIYVLRWMLFIVLRILGSRVTATAGLLALYAGVVEVGAGSDTAPVFAGVVIAILAVAYMARKAWPYARPGGPPIRRRRVKPVVLPSVKIAVQGSHGVDLETAFGRLSPILRQTMGEPVVSVQPKPRKSASITRPAGLDPVPEAT